jgi:protein SCO1
LRAYSTRPPELTRVELQPFSWKALVLFVVTAGGLTWYFEHEKERMQKKRIAEANKSVGKPKVGGSFKLVDQDGRPFTDEDMKGRYSLVRTPAATTVRYQIYEWGS